ncbi:MAG: hypothetical protein F6K31_31710 [Symploca sp. SIO2G7]|nr:hypothetical protein [Symploca sp. SIO2G7]
MRIVICHLSFVICHLLFVVCCLGISSHLPYLLVPLVSLSPQLPQLPPFLLISSSPHSA